MSKIRVGGVWKNFTRKIRVGGVWKLACLKYRIGGEWKEDGCGFTLVLPPRAVGDNNTINLADFITAENVDNKTTVKVVNNSIQPQIISGDIVALGLNKVTFINSGEIQGNNSGADGLIVSTAGLILQNNGIIKGAGGEGGDGGKGKDITYAPVYTLYNTQGPFYSPPTSAVIGTAFWVDGIKEGTSSGSSVTNYYSGGKVVISKGAYQGLYGGADSWSVIVKHYSDTSPTDKIGGAGGAGGAGAQFNNLPSQFGEDGFPSSPTGGYSGGNGGNGGDWSLSGTDGLQGDGTGTLGTAGQEGGNAISGSGLLESGSNTGTVVGDIIT